MGLGSWGEGVEGVFEIPACNVMFNIGTGIENVNHLKKKNSISVWCFQVWASIRAFGSPLRRSPQTVRNCTRNNHQIQ